MAGMWKILIAGDQFDGGIFAATAGRGEDVYQSTDNADRRTLAHTGLTSTELAELEIATRHFAATVL